MHRCFICYRIYKLSGDEFSGNAEGLKPVNKTRYRLIENEYIKT